MLWKKVPISQVYFGLYDGPHATPKPAKSGPIFLGIKNITEDGALDLSEIRHIAEDDFPAWTRRVEPRQGDIVFTYEATLNRYAIIPPGFRGCLGRRLALIRPDNEVVDTRFLFYYFFTSEWRETVARKTLYGSTVDRIPLTEFPRFELSQPPLPIQRKIAAILSAYDDLIENNNKRIIILEEMARLIYREWFVNFRFPGHANVDMVDSQLGQIPNTWRVKTVGDFGRVITGKTPSKKKPEYYGDYMQFIKTPDMIGNVFIIKTKDYLSRKGADSQLKATLPADTLCTTCIGTPGVVSITSQASQTNQQINSVVLHDTTNREFLYFCLQDLKDTIKGYGAVGATMVNLSKSKFEGLQVISPEKEVLNRFNNIVSPIFDEIKVLQKKNVILQSVRDLLLPRLLLGEIDVSELDIRTGEDAA